MTTVRRYGWFMVAALLLASACAGTRKELGEIPAEVKPPTDAWAWLPADGTFVGRLSLEQLRKTQLWPMWAEVEQEQKIDAWVSLDKVVRLTFGGTGQTRDDLSYVAALEGEFSLLELSSLAKQDDTPRERHGALTFYRRPDSWWTQIDESLIVVCTQDRVEEVARRASAGPGTPVKEHALYKTLAERVSFDTSHVAMIAEDPEGKGKAMLDQHANQYGLGDLTNDAKRLGFSVEIGNDYRVIAVAETPDEDRAQALEDLAREKLASVQSNMIVRMLGLGGLVTRLRVSNETNFVFVRGAIPEADFNAAVERLHRMLSVAKGPAHVSKKPSSDEAAAESE